MTTEPRSSDAEGAETFMATLYLTEQYSVVKIEGEALRVQFPTERASEAGKRKIALPNVPTAPLCLFNVAFMIERDEPAWQRLRGF